MVLAQIQNGSEVAISYGGRDLNAAERNYSATEREALAVVAAVKKFQPYLHGRKFTIYTNHNALQWLMKISEPTGKLARWSLLIQQFDFDIVHRPGVKNGNADALSRRPYTNIRALDTEGVAYDQIRDQQQKDTDLFNLVQYLQEGVLPDNDDQARRILLEHDNYYLDTEGHPSPLVVSLRP